MIGVGANGPLASERGTGGAAANGGAPSASGEYGGWTSVNLADLDPRTETPYWIALSLVPGVGPVGFARLLRRFGSGEAAWAAGSAMLGALPRVPDDAAPALARLRREGVTAVAARVREATRRSAGTVITALDRGYPPALAAADPRPPVLYVAGDPTSMEGLCVAIVGTRRPTGYGRACAAEIADELARAGVTVVSGLALGIDGQAHLAAVEVPAR